MNLELITRSVIILIFGILAVIFVNVSRKRLFAAGLAFAVITYFLMTLWWPDAREALNATATVVVAGTAILAIFLNRQQREDARKREERDRKERSLSEIIEWAEDTARLNFKIYNLIEAQIKEESWVESGLGEIVSEFQVVEAKGVYINSIALSSFREDRNLSRATKAANRGIRELVDASVKRLDHEVASDTVSEHMNILRSRIEKLLKETARVKAEI